ncbi:hypothetical protein EIN_020280 [Entamoeba invadens IP1]|uniref:hypothetical protein n=1 Tax=Entamoeba invadens IP1 TaxID=370355 RepID=UPI0002C3F553|nr:hypothetical protein EIN_020280 [Entamoeba invadens IP1]ELP90579.1 hypothetical protein EIN_020280 [Entamoeba invadens IP1]|eukprot:XP_004257350.1 hypothetical protein EIN_020280 [Entamoeba invadens IP1]
MIRKYPTQKWSEHDDRPSTQLLRMISFVATRSHYFTLPHIPSTQPVIHSLHLSTSLSPLTYRPNYATVPSCSQPTVGLHQPKLIRNTSQHLSSVSSGPSHQNDMNNTQELLFGKDWKNIARNGFSKRFGKILDNEHFKIACFLFPPERDKYLNLRDQEHIKRVVESKLVGSRDYLTAKRKLSIQLTKDGNDQRVRESDAKDSGMAKKLGEYMEDKGTSDGQTELHETPLTY